MMVSKGKNKMPGDFFKAVYIESKLESFWIRSTFFKPFIQTHKGGRKEQKGHIVM